MLSVRNPPPPPPPLVAPCYPWLPLVPYMWSHATPTPPPPPPPPLPLRHIMWTMLLPGQPCYPYHICGAILPPWYQPYMLPPGTSHYMLPPGTSHICYPLVPAIYVTPWYQPYMLPPGTSHICYPLVPAIYVTPWYQPYMLPPGTSHICYPLVPAIYGYFPVAVIMLVFFSDFSFTSRMLWTLPTHSKNP